MEPKVRVLVADDHAIFRQGVISVIERQPGLELAGEAADGLEAVRLAESLAPRLVVMDIAMPGLSGIEAASRILARRPEVGVIMLSVHTRKTFVMEALKAGAKAYLLKDSAWVELVKAMEAVLRGESYLDPAVTGLIIGEAVKTGGPEAAASHGLTPRELQVLRLIVEGLSNREIAARLFVSPKTVENHRGNLMAKLGVHDVVGLVKHALAHGLAEVEK